MKEMIFTGFSLRTIRFLNDLRENNYKEWFEDNRHVYERELLKPFKALVSSLSPTMHNIDSGFELRPHRVLSRIYRDTRFSKNKEPYKDHMWMTFQLPVENWENYPGYFLELRADSYTYGMGLYAAKKKVMDGFRDNVAYNANEFEKITQTSVFERGFEIQGEGYKRLLDNDLTECFQPWLQKKSLWVAKTRPMGEEVFSAQFAEQIREDFVALEWLYNFFKESQP